MEPALRVVVVGAGAAGSAAAVALRRAAPAVEVVVVGAEDRAPYNRTTVNKGLLSGAVDDRGIALPGMHGHGIDWRLGSAAAGLDPAARTVALADGSLLTGDAVVLATGAAPRPLPAPVAPDAQDRVRTLRSAADTRRLRALLDRDPGRVVIAGAGLIGTETASVLRAAGHPVTLVDTARRPLSGAVGASAAGWIADAHRRAGIDLRAGAAVAGVRADGTGLRVGLDDGADVSAAAVLACLGVDPALDWLRGVPLPLDPAHGGVLVDACQRVQGLPGLYAAGDLAALPGPDAAPVRVEHWGAALDQGRTAAAAVLADLGARTPDGGRAEAPEPAPAVPGYSTYVHGTKLTILGRPGAAVAERPVLGRVGDPRFAFALLDAADRVVGAVGVGGARAANRLRPLIERRAPAAELAEDDAPAHPAPQAG